ncbi:MAG: acetyl-CoA carboxylase biotin carboxyl carrier protein subunit [Clostridiales bacterium]|nr:acetyl-CoA carboxylase biotin carboxyl carrier protein subunit [Clostridiales bacterium]
MRNFIVTIDGKSYSVGVEEVGANESAPAIPVAVPEVKASAPVIATKATLSGEKVLSPFPGLIKKLLVADGATVKKDQPVIVLEAMKMDNEITAPCDGVITFNVATGSNVETNAVLAVIG